MRRLCDSTQGSNKLMQDTDTHVKQPPAPPPTVLRRDCRYDDLSEEHLEEMRAYYGYDSYHPSTYKVCTTRLSLNDLQVA